MSERQAFGQHSGDDAEQHVDELLEQMTLAEKVGQMIGTAPHEDVEQLKSEIRDHHLGSVHFGGTPHNTPEKKAKVANTAQKVAVEESRLGIPVFLRAMAEHGHAAVAGSTVFSQQLGLGATRNPDIVAQTAAVAATEMRATGTQSTSSPIGDVARDQRWGRIAETFGEAPLLCAEMTAAMVRGYQGDGADFEDEVLAVTKHYPAYSEGLRGEDQAPNEVTDYTLRRVHVPPYAAGIDAGTAGIMPCYNSINGEPVHGSKRFLHDLLREDLGFDGFVLADARGAEDLHKGHHATESREESIWLSIRAGMDILPFGGPEYCEYIVDLVEDGELSEERIEESARRVLLAKHALGLFEDPYVDVDEAVATLGNDEHRQVARQAARETMTLLKNDDDVLPLSPDLGEVLVTGPNADNIANQHGGWGNTADPDPMGDTVLDGIKAAAGDGTTVTHEPGSEINDEVDIDAAASAAADADAAVVVLGEPDYVHEFRGSVDDFGLEDFPNRWDLSLPDAQLDLVKAVQETGTPTVVVFVTARVLATPWVAEHVPAILMAYQPGSEGGAVADVLFGEYNPHGKLPISVPRSVGHVPVRFNYLTHPMEGNDQQPISYDPLFAYGHGLSYTEFEYEGIELSESEVGPSETVEVDVTVANTGDRAGIEAVELFVNDVISTRITPVRELVDFTRVELDAGERETVQFSLNVEDVGIVEDDGTRTVEPGTFEVLAGDLTAEFEVVRRRPFTA